MMESRLIYGGTHMTQEMTNLAIEIKHRYPNLGLAWIPPDKREPTDDKHWAIVINNEAGEIVDVVKELTTFECTEQNVLRWLWENDSTRMDPWEKFQKETALVEEQKRQAAQEDIEERAEKVHAIASSPLHTYRIDGKKIG